MFTILHNQHNNYLIIILLILQGKIKKRKNLINLFRRYQVLILDLKIRGRQETIIIKGKLLKYFLKMKIKYKLFR